MASIIGVLEERLLKNLLVQETKKSWDEWIQWLVDLDCTLTFEKPINIPNRPFSFQTWLAACEKQLINHPDWQARFSTPEWLIRQRVTIIPNILKRADNNFTPGIEEIGGLNLELTRLIDQIHNVQQLVTHLETGTSQSVGNQVDSSVSQKIHSVEFSKANFQASGLSDSLGRPDLARTLERELQLHNKGAKDKDLKKSRDSDEKNDPEIIPLKEAYLSFNRWCDQFDEVHLDLQEFVNDSLRVKNSHQISFQQFSHRIIQKAKDVKELEQVLESFSRLRNGGVDINLKEKFGDEKISKTVKNT